MSIKNFASLQIQRLAKTSRTNQLVFGLSGLVLVLIGLNLTLLRVADITTLNPIADAYVDGDTASTNYGSATTLAADGVPATRAYLKFDLTNYTNYEIESAILRLYVTNSSTDPYSIKGVETSEWEEGELTYENEPLRTATYGTIPSSSVGSWAEINITQAAINHRGSLMSVAVVSDGTSNGMEFNSRESGSNKPELVITGTPDADPIPDSFVFTAVGDFGNNWSSGSNLNTMLAGMGAQNPDFALGLGDFLYSNTTANVDPWCTNVKSKLGEDTPFQIIAGNHDSGADNADIITTETDTLRECVPSKVNNFTSGEKINKSAYGLEYYFDYPNPTNPLMRVILVSPGLWGWTYDEGTDNYEFVQNAILDARDTGRENGPIPWIVVGHHKNCITNGTKGCEISQDLFNLMLGKNLGPGGTGYGTPVDLILEGHEHTYHRSKHLKTNASTCATILVGGYDSDCVTGSGGNFIKDEGSVLAIIGTGGVSLRSINSAADAETDYFEAWNATNEAVPSGDTGAVGFSKFTVTPTTIQGEYIATNGKNYSDSFTISKPVPTLHAEVHATVETDPVPNSGDAADDPAIYADPNDPDNSVVFGTDKLGGLVIYDMDGNELQYYADGNINNVDIRTDYTLDGQSVILVTATNRTQQRIEAYTYDPVERELTNVTGSTTAGFSTYGYCMYQSPFDGKTYGVVTRDSSGGGASQFELTDSGSGTVNATQVRTFDEITTRAEGCVGDDDLGYLYIGEEDVAIWKYSAEPSDGNSRTAVDYTTAQGGDHLVSDIEGLTIFYTDSSTGYLIASNQGNNSYSVYEREGSNAYIGDFAIVDGDIDGTSDTDGIDVINANLGSNFPYGAFVAQDGTNPGANQNFKIVPWESIMSMEFIPVPTTPPTPMPTPDLTVISTISVVADSHVDATSPDENFGTSSVLVADGDPSAITYMKFDLAEFDTKEILSAKLRLRLTNGSNGTYNLRQVADTSWGEDTITFNNAPERGSIIAYISDSSPDSWVELDVTSYAQDKKGGLASFSISSSGTADGINIASKEAENYHPELIITYAKAHTGSTTIRGGTRIQGGTRIRGSQ